MDLDDFDDDLANEMINLSDSLVELHEQEEMKDGAGSRSQDEPDEDHLKILHKWFGHKNFRPMQWDIIKALTEDRRDVCAIMATGYGKSLCYQYPAIWKKGITLVVSPLISLMEDQVLALTTANIPACLLGSAQTRQQKIIEEIFEKKYSLVYLTPEFSSGDHGAEMLKKMSTDLDIVLIAIDEAHCVSSWGHDFRFQYRTLGRLRRIFLNVPILAVTATATSKVCSDITTSLELRNPLVVKSGFDRPNLYFEVNLKGNCGVFGDIKRYMIKQDSVWRFTGPTIIYCITRKQTEEIAEILTRNGVQALPYHAGLSLSVRKDVHEKFSKDQVDVIVATIAFGMGIDRPDIRNVIHYGASRSIEDYYQEVGRAGRDGAPSNCIMFYSKTDFAIHRRLIETTIGNETAKARRLDKLDHFEKYLLSTDCRRCFILKHFGDRVDHLQGPRTNCCDNCTRRRATTQTLAQTYEGIDEKGLYDFTEDARKFLGAVQALNGKFGTIMYIKFLRKSNDARIYERLKQHALYGTGKDKTEEWWKAIAALLFREKYLLESFAKPQGRYQQAGYTYSTMSLSPKGGRFLLDSKSQLSMAPPPDIARLLKRKPQASTGWIDVAPLNAPSTSKVIKPAKEDESSLEDRMSLYKKLIQKRSDLSTKHDCMPYMVASNAILMDMSKQQPTNLAQLRSSQLNGFTEAKLEKFGEDFLQVVREHRDSKPRADSQQQPSNDPDCKPSIRQVLSRYPMIGASSLNSTSEVSFFMYDKGKTVAEIATERGFAESTIITHLIRCMKLGFPVKLHDLDLTDDQIRLISREILKHYPDLNDPRIKPVKETCPEEITFNQIASVVAYMTIRKHLKNLNMPYEDFDDLNVPLESSSPTNTPNNHFESDKTSSDESPVPSDVSKGMLSTVDAQNDGSDCDTRLAALIDGCNELLADEDSDSDVTVIADDDLPKDTQITSVSLPQQEEILPDTIKTEELNDASDEPPSKKTRISDYFKVLVSPPSQKVVTIPGIEKESEIKLERTKEKRDTQVNGAAVPKNGAPAKSKKLPPWLMKR